MVTRFKVDEDLPTEIAQRLRTAGYDAMTVIEEDLSGAVDSRVWGEASREKRCLVTAGKGFADVRKYPLGTHHGIVLFRLPRESRQGYIHPLESTLEDARIESFHGAIVVASPDAIRIRREERT